MELQEKTLVVKRHDMVYEDVMANYVSFIICYSVFSYESDHLLGESHPMQDPNSFIKKNYLVNQVEIS